MLTHGYKGPQSRPSLQLGGPGQEGREPWTLGLREDLHIRSDAHCLSLQLVLQVGELADMEPLKDKNWLSRHEYSLSGVCDSAGIPANR